MYVDASVYNDIPGAGPEDVHAGEVETSLMLHLEYESVGDDRVDCVPDTTPAVFNTCGMKRISPDGAWGFPSRGTADKGAEYFEALVEAVIGRIRHTEEVLAVVK